MIGNSDEKRISTPTVRNRSIGTDLGEETRILQTLAIRIGFEHLTRKACDFCTSCLQPPSSVLRSKHIKEPRRAAVV